VKEFGTHNNRHEVISLVDLRTGYRHKPLAPMSFTEVECELHVVAELTGE